MDFSTDIKRQLSDIVGPAGVLSSDTERARYETGARNDTGKAAMILRPSTTQEVSQIVGLCARHGIGMIAQSGNTGVVSGSIPDDSGKQVLISLDRLNKSFELDVDNRSLCVDAGMLLSQVNGRLEEHGLMLPIDLGADPAIGGMVSTNTGGSRFIKYGNMRRHVLGLTVVLPDEHGTTMQFGSALRKDNSGIDWKHIFIGTGGSFGVITECVLNLERVPLQTATALLIPESPESVMRLLTKLEELCGDELSAVEGMSGNAIRAALEHTPSLRNPFAGGVVPDYVILVELSRKFHPRSGELSLENVIEDVLSSIMENDLGLADALFGRPTEIWALRHALSEGIKNAGKLVAVDICLERGKLLPACAALRDQITKRWDGAIVCDFGHIGDGGVHFNTVMPGSTSPDVIAELRDWIIDIAVRDFGATFSSEHGVGRKNQRYYDLYTPEQNKMLARGLKEVLAPGSIGAAHFG